ncbi:hypothetical protein GF359_00035, partial [candidate division WOR-3 bacterium]|nr:hypothetical protein [candidate division WOR-3 bacterium]MBD3363583.1 hypothetical protein [candidate division WOR-3 bacterium]
MKRLVILTWVIIVPISLSAQESFLSYVYAYNDIVVFSHQNSSDYQMEKTDGTPVWSNTLDENEYELITDLEPGVYKVACPNEFSVVSGDPWGMGLGTWCAVDQFNRPASTKLLSVGPKYLEASGNYAEGVIGIFAYQSGTHATLTDIDADTSIWEGDLDEGEYYLYCHDDPDSPAGFPYSVEASNPVSAMTLNGMGGMYVPAFNGTFTGKDFMTYSPYCYQNGDVTKNIAVLPWEDNTRVVIVDLDNPSDTIWDYVCPEAGIIEGTDIALPGRDDRHGRGLKAHSDKDICFMHVPYATYGNNLIGFYIMAGMNRDGSGIGTEFHLPLGCSGSSGYESRLHVIAYMDDAQ